MPLLLLKHWRLGVAAILLLALAGAYLQHGHRRYKAGAAAVQALWDKDRASMQRVVDEAMAVAQIKEQTAQAYNEQVLDEYNEKLLSAAGERDSYVSLLQHARGQVRACTAGEATGALIAASAGEASVLERIDRAVAGVVIEHRANADQLDALIAVITPQLDTP